MLEIGSFDFANPATGAMVTGPITKTLEPKLIVRQNPFASVDEQVDHVFNAIMEWAVPIRLHSLDGTAEGLARNIAALNAELTKKANTVTDKLDRAVTGTPATVYAMYRSKPILSDRQDLTEKRLIWEGTITLRTAPFGSAFAPITLTLDPDTFSDTGLFALCEWSDDETPTALPLLGDLDAPLAVSLATAHGATGMKNVVCAVCPSDTVVGDYDLGLSGYVGGGSDPDYLAASVTIAGRFRVLARLQAEDEPVVRVGIGQDGAIAPVSSVGVVNTGTHVLVSLGEFDSTGTTELRVFASGGRAHIYDVVIVPVDGSCVSAWGLDSVEALTFAADGNSLPALTTGNGLVAPVDHPQLLVVCDPSTAVVTVSVIYTALLYGWASS